MELAFLEARMPLTKRYTASKKEPYPHAYEFKSHKYLVSSLSEIRDLMKKHAALGHSLLKGTLSKDLNWESRAGSTSATDMTDWLCFDIDNINSISNIDVFMAKLGLTDVSYILQWSSSYGIHNKFDLRAHVFVLNETPVSPDYAKLFLKHHNLVNFKDDLTLTRTNNALSWALDITTCQNDKLLYIAPPECDPPSLNHFTGERITLVQKQSERCDISAANILSAENIKTLEESEINRLRQQKNLPERKPSKFKLKEYKNEHYLPDPDQAVVTGIKQERDFVYLNLNGGDSWGYYHPADNPTFIYNFKGEPTYKTAELVPDYWSNIKRSQQQAARQKHQNKLFLAFRDFKSAEYYNGWYDRNTDELTLHVARSEKQLEDFLVNYGQPVPDAVPIWNLIYDPHRPTLDLGAKELNLFRPSTYMKQADENLRNNSAALFAKGSTPVIDHIITHAMGEEAYEYFFNWLAYKFQKRNSAKTAWVLHGTQGTGKGLLVNYIISPLFGHSNVVQKRMEELEDKFFTSALERALFVIIDEAQISDSGRSKMIMANLKNQITEPVISIRRMRQNAYEVPNRASFIFNSNKIDPVTVETGDRRFNVGEYQPNKIQISDIQLNALSSELVTFSNKLITHKVDTDKVRTPLMNEAKRRMQMASRTSADIVADALLTGQLDALWDALPSDTKSLVSISAQMQAADYTSLVHDLVKTKRAKLSRDELYIIFEYNVGKIPSSPYKLTQYLKHKGLDIKNIRLFGKQTKGIEIDQGWQNSDEWFESCVEDLKAPEFTGKSGQKVNVLDGKSA